MGDVRWGAFPKHFLLIYVEEINDRKPSYYHKYRDDYFK